MSRVKSRSSDFISSSTIPSVSLNPTHNTALLRAFSHTVIQSQTTYENWWMGRPPETCSMMVRIDSKPDSSAKYQPTQSRKATKFKVNPPIQIKTHQLPKGKRATWIEPVTSSLGSWIEGFYGLAGGGGKAGEQGITSQKWPRFAAHRSLARQMPLMPQSCQRDHATIMP